MWSIEVRDAHGRTVARAALKDGAATIGRGTDRSLVVPATSVSRKHARLEVKAGRLFLVDEGSANGSFVNGQRIAAPTEVGESSTIRIAEFKIAIQAVAPGGESPLSKVQVTGPLPSLPDLVPVGQWAAETTAARPVAAQTAAPPPARPSAPPAAQDDLPSFIPVQPAPAPDSAAAVTSDWQATDVLDKQIQSFRSHREQVQLTAAQREQQLNQDWDKLVASLRQLQARLQKEPRVQSFLISRDGKEISIKIADAREKRGYRYFLVSREHPEGKFPGLDAVWLRELGRDDMNFREPQRLLMELMQRIAGTLA